MDTCPNDSQYCPVRLDVAWWETCGILAESIEEFICDSCRYEGDRLAEERLAPITEGWDTTQPRSASFSFTLSEEAMDILLGNFERGADDQPNT